MGKAFILNKRLRIKVCSACGGSHRVKPDKLMGKDGFRCPTVDRWVHVLPGKPTPQVDPARSLTPEKILTALGRIKEKPVGMAYYVEKDVPEGRKVGLVRGPDNLETQRYRKLNEFELRYLAGVHERSPVPEIIKQADQDKLRFLSYQRGSRMSVKWLIEESNRVWRMMRAGRTPVADHIPAVKLGLKRADIEPREKKLKKEWVVDVPAELTQELADSIHRDEAKDRKQRSQDWKDLSDIICEYTDGEEILVADGFERAFLGLGERCSQPLLAIYDYNKAVKILMERDGMSEQEAIEFIDFNVVGAWVGPKTPIFLSPMEVYWNEKVRRSKPVRSGCCHGKGRCAGKAGKPRY